MITLKNTILVISILLCFACSKNDDDHKNAEPGEESTFSFIVKNNTGQNLLDPQTPNTYNTNNIRVFQVVNGETLEINDPLLEAQHGYLITHDIDSVYRMRPYLIYQEGLDRTAYIKWNDQDTDTLQLHLEHADQNNFLTKIWYNGEKVYDWDDYIGSNNPRRFVIEKP